MLTQDQWWNALCQSYEFQDGSFVKSFNIYPNLESTVVHAGLQDDLNFIFKYLYDVKGSDHLVNTSSFSMFYDDTFEIGPFLVTPITFINVMMEDPQNDNKSPTQPAGFFIHELRCTEAYKHNLGIMAECFPHLKTAKVPFIIDGDDALKNAIEETTEGFVVRCHNHIGTNIKDQCYKQKVRMTKSEMEFYRSQIMQIFHKDTLHEALLFATELFSKLNDDGSPVIPTFLSNYVRKNLLPAEKIRHIGKWEIEKFGVYVPGVGAVNSREEGFNAVLKRFQNHEFQELDGVLATLDKISHYYWLENQKSKAGIGRYSLAAWAKPFFDDIDPHALRISDIKNPDEFVTELLTSRNKASVHNEKESSPPAESIVFDSAPKDIHIEITDDLLLEMPRDILSDDLPNSPDILVDFGSVEPSSEKDGFAPINKDLIGLLDIEDIPVIMEENERENLVEENTVDESVNLMNFDEPDTAKPTNQEEMNDSFDLLDLDEMVEELNKSFEFEVTKGSEDNIPSPLESENPELEVSNEIENPESEISNKTVSPEHEVSTSKKRKPECMEDDNLPQQSSKTIVLSQSGDDEDLTYSGFKRNNFENLDNYDHKILSLQKFESDLCEHIKTEDNVQIITMLRHLLRMHVNLDMILTNNIGKMLTHLKVNRSENISRAAGRLCRRWKMVLVSSSSKEYTESVFKALNKKLVTGSRAKLLMEYISNNDEEVETVEQEPELDTNPIENQHEVNANENTEEASTVDEIPSEGIHPPEIETVLEEPELETNPIENDHQVVARKNTEEESNVDEFPSGVIYPQEVETAESEYVENLCKEADNIEANDISEEQEYAENLCIEANENPIPNQRVGMKDLPDNLVTKYGRAKICVDEGRVTRVQNKKTGTVSYTIEEGNKVFLVKSTMVNNKVDFQCSCSVTGACTSFHIDAVKYFTTGAISGSTLRPNMRKLGYLKKKSNKKELAGKKPTKFNSTKFVELQHELREHQAALVEYEEETQMTNVHISEEVVEDDILEVETEVESLFCNICNKKYGNAKGLKIHTTKAHGSTKAPDKAAYHCNFCEKSYSSEKGLKIHKSKSH